MNITLSSEFEVVAANIAAQVFPNTQYQLLAQEIGERELAITFKSHKNFSENFRVRFFANKKNLILSGYYKESIY
ncbi:MAG: hypothetical protein PUP92_00560, partial [Rhizonema sp. PD38]|nr:hypothetical protein [Rhizonema sp. PD38]